MTRKIVIVSFGFLWASSRSQTGTFNPGEYFFTVKDCFKAARYTEGFKRDSLAGNHIFKGTRIWRSIALSNKQNQHVFNTNSSCQDVGFFEIIKFGLLEKKLSAFNSDNFDVVEKSVLSNDEIKGLISYRDTTPQVYFDALGMETKVKTSSLKVLVSADVKTYLVKEDWIFNSYSGVMQKYIVAIAPLIYNDKQTRVLPLFWLYYPEWKGLFASFDAQNPFSFEPITFCDVFEKHYYFSVISKESNVFDRGIKTYKHGYEINYESELIKEKLLNSESDLFEH